MSLPQDTLLRPFLTTTRQGGKQPRQKQSPGLFQKHDPRSYARHLSTSALDTVQPDTLDSGSEETLKNFPHELSKEKKKHKMFKNRTENAENISVHGNNEMKQKMPHELSKDKKKHKTLAHCSEDEEMMQKISHELSEEQKKNKRLTNRVEEAENLAAWLKDKLDLVGIKKDDLDCAHLVEHRAPSAMHARCPLNQLQVGDNGLLDRTIEGKQPEQYLQMRDKLNCEKLKVICLKRDAKMHAEELEKLGAMMKDNQKLQKDMTDLHEDNSRFRENLGMAKQEIATLTEKLAESTKLRIHPEEMELLNQALMSRLDEDGRELSEHRKEHSEIVDPFFQSALDLLMQIFEKLDGARDKNQKLPALFDPSSQDIRMKFMSILDALQYVHEVIRPPDEAGRSVGTNASILNAALHYVHDVISPANEDGCTTNAYFY